MTSLLEAARALADQLGGFGTFAVTAALPADDPDARRTLISSELLDEDRDPTSFNDYVVYAAGGRLGGEQAAVRRDLFDGTNGRLYTSGLFSSVPEVGQEFEYHSRLPRLRHFGEPGLRDVLNQALNRLWFPDDLAFQATGGTSYPAPAWLTSDRQMIDVKEQAAMVGLNPAPAGRSATLVHTSSAGTRIQLSSPWSAGATFYVVARRPHATWVKAGGTWGDSTAGLVDDEDETLCDLEPLLCVAAWLAYRALNRRSPDFELGPWKEEEARWEAKASAYLQWGQDTTAPLRGAGTGGSLGWSKGWTP